MKFLPLFPVVTCAALLASCGDGVKTSQPLNVVSGHIVMGATDDRPAVGYFRVQGGPQDVELVAVTAQLAQRVEMHETVRENDMLLMKEIPSAAVPAGGSLEFKQGGKHLMIWGVNPAAVRDGKMTMQFLFTKNNNERIIFDMVIKPALEGAVAEPGAGHGSSGH